MIDLLRYDFGYTWPWTYGHLIVAIVSGAAAALACRIQRRVIAGIFAVLCVWAGAGVLLVHGPMGFSRPLTLPTEDFLPSGAGRVLDAGAGSGRATIMVLQSRPRSTVVALDIYSGYYGIDDNTPDRLMANARAAGASGRVEARVGDIRAMPFEAGSFDAAVSTYVIDHLNRDGVNKSLGEIARVLRPDGQFLMMVVNPDLWVRVAFPHLAAHGYFGPGPSGERWRTALDAAGLAVVEEGTRPGTMYFLAKKRRTYGTICARGAFPASLVKNVRKRAMRSRPGVEITSATSPVV